MMQRFFRHMVASPVYLGDDRVVAARERARDHILGDAEKRGQTDAPRFELSLDHPSVLEALRKLFHGKCAFCEGAGVIRVHRLRPPADAVPFTGENGHLYYSWLAEAWQNLFPLCTGCEPVEPASFPVSGRRARIPGRTALDAYVSDPGGNWTQYPPNETALLIDPCHATGLWDDLSPTVDGRLVGLSIRGSTTIGNFQLNRAELVGRRAQRFREYFEHFLNASKVATGQRRRVGGAALFEFSEMEFGGTWYLLLRRLAVAIGGAERIAPTRIRRFFTELHRQRDFERTLRRAWEQIGEADVGDVSVPSAPLAITRASLASLTLRNFKGIESLTIRLPDAPLVVPSKTPPPVPSLLLIGENAAGKSSILEAVAIALSRPDARAALPIRPERFVLDPRLMGSADADDVRTAEIVLTLTDKSRTRLVIEDNQFRERHAGGYGRLPVFAYGAFRRFETKERDTSDVRHIRNLFDNSVLSNPERWLLSLDDNVAFPMVARALRHILSFERDFEVIRRAKDDEKCFLVTEMACLGEKAIRTESPLGAVSSGFRSVLAMACDIMAGLMDPRMNPDFEMLTTARGVILIDEVEAHLHPRWKMQIMRGLRAALPRMTFIATTHDPLCLRGMSDGEVTVLQRVAASGTANRSELPVVVERLDTVPDVSRLTVEQLLTSDIFQLYSTEKPELDESMAEIAQLLTLEREGKVLDERQSGTLQRFKREVVSALPIGGSETQRIVQEAVATYLAERRRASGARMKRLRRDAKDRIVAVLRAI